MIIDAPVREQLPALQRLWRVCFGDSQETVETFFRTGFSIERCRCVTVDDKLAAALYWLDAQCRGQKLAYLYAVGTDPAFRNRGLCQALMESTHRHLAAAGYDGAVLAPENEALFAFYGKLGYRPFGGVQYFSAEAAGEPAAMERLSGEAYAARRRKLLRPGDVIQEGPALAWLGTYASFYAGDGFLLAAAWENGALRVQEYLGDPAVAPGILTALGAARGQFRTPGQEPFAMYLGLSPAGAEPPGYFGLALD